MGAADWVVDGATGRHVRQGDRQALAMALQEVQAEAAVRWGQDASRRYWEQPFSLARHVARLMEVYQPLLRSRRLAA